MSQYTWKFFHLSSGLDMRTLRWKIRFGRIRAKRHYWNGASMQTTLFGFPGQLSSHLTDSFSELGNARCSHLQKAWDAWLFPRTLLLSFSHRKYLWVTVSARVRTSLYMRGSVHRVRIISWIRCDRYFLFIPLHLPPSSFSPPPPSSLSLSPEPSIS